MYRTIRNVHLLLASLSLPFLLVYGVSAVQMSHPAWFQMRPSVTERQVSLTAGLLDARAVAREIMDREAAVRGDLLNVQSRPDGFALRIVVPGTVHEVQYMTASGDARVKTSVAGFMGMLNRLHHTAGLWHEHASLQLWGAAVAVVSAALVGVGLTGIYMWFTRRAERRTGIVLLLVNAVFVGVVLTLMRSAGP
jgi:hypothetical protein